MELNCISAVIILTLSVCGTWCINRKSQNERTSVENLTEINHNNSNNKLRRTLFSPYLERVKRYANGEYGYPTYENYYPRSPPYDPPYPAYGPPTPYGHPPPRHYGEKHGQHGGIHVAKWRWDEIGVFFTFTAFIVITGLAKVAFHHAHWLSSRVPESCLMIIVGVVVGAILFLSGVPEPENKQDKVLPDGEFALPTFTPRLFFLILLPPVILESAYSLYDRSFADNLFTILIYAVIGTLFNTFLIGPLLYLISIGGLMGLSTLPFIDTVVFAALISAVDPVAVLAIFQEVGVNKDLYYLLFGESLLNDAVTVVLYTTTENFVGLSGPVDGTQIGLAFVSFFTVSLGGLLIGIIFGLLTALLTKTTQDVRIVEPLAVLGIAYLSYLSAELFHFSGIIGIIGCGLVQAHYALKNISENSRTTVIYFTKMISSTSDAIIFLFLGMVLVSKHHEWHTGFVIWTLVLCLICRFMGVFSLTWIINVFRVKKINTQEQFIMAYGGLRGAVAFSLVTMLDKFKVPFQPIFLTTTLVIILFTVFIQGGTIKLFVNLLNIEKSRGEEKTMNEEINDNIIRTMMAGIEEITGVRGDNYLRRKIEYIDENYLKRMFLNTTKSNSLTRLYEKLALTQHFAHLYGPVALVEDHKATILHTDTTPRKKLPRSLSARAPHRPTLRLSELFPGVQLRRRTLSDTTRPPSEELETGELRTSTEQLRKAFRSNPYQKIHERYDPNLCYGFDEFDITNMLKKRHQTAKRITYQAAMSHRHSATPTTEEVPLAEEFQTPRRKIHSELEGVDPEALEGMDIILERARRRVVRHSSNVEMFSDLQPRTDTTSEPSTPSAQGFIPRTNYYTRSPRNLTRTRKTSGTLDPYQETPETQPMIRPVLRQHSMFSRFGPQQGDGSTRPQSPTLGISRSSPRDRPGQGGAQRPESPSEESEDVHDIHESRL